MKPLFLLPFCLLLHICVYSQQKTSVLVVSNQEGKLIIDGVEQNWLKSSEPAKLTLDQGDHIIQLKTSLETYTKTVSCADGTQKVVTFDASPNSNVGVNSASAVANNSMNLIMVADLQLDIPGSVGKSRFVNEVYSFDEGDEISFDYDMANKNGTVNIFLHSYPENGPIYSKEKITALNEEKIVIPKRGMYYFSFSSNHIVGRSAHFVLKRKPRSEAGRVFKTGVQLKYDTSYQEVQNDQVHVYSTGNIGHTNRTIVRINLPAQTTYWVYWIGVGQESEIRLKQFAQQLSGAASKFVANPLLALGLNLIPALPAFNSSATVDYRFADNANSELFLSGHPSTCYAMKAGTNITADFSIIKSVSNEMNLCLWNNSPLLGHDVTVKVAAFIVRPYYIPEE